MTDAPNHPEPSPHVPTKWQRRIPNLLTFARLILAAAFVLLLSMFDIDNDSANPNILLAAIALFIVAALTDALDGYLARKWNAVSPFGRIMDPFADKVLILGAFVMLAGPGLASPEGFTISGFYEWTLSYNYSGFMPWMVVLILARELLVTSIRGVYESRGIDFSASFTGKLKMILQSVSIPVVLLILYLWMTQRIDASYIYWNLVIALGVTIATVWSAVPYVSRAIKMRGALSD